jgi:hypothetical protein
MREARQDHRPKHGMRATVEEVQKCTIPVAMRFAILRPLSGGLRVFQCAGLQLPNVRRPSYEPVICSDIRVLGADL